MITCNTKLHFVYLYTILYNAILCIIPNTCDTKHTVSRVLCIVLDRSGHITKGVLSGRIHCFDLFGTKVSQPVIMWDSVSQYSNMLLLMRWYVYTVSIPKLAVCDLSKLSSCYCRVTSSLYQ